jgi:hypothetical protein
VSPRHFPDVGRLVIQCGACGRCSRWSDEDAARAQGWHHAWAEGGSLRSWTCSDCYVPPPAPPGAMGLPAYLRGLLATKPDLAEEQLAMLRANEPARWSSAIEELRQAAEVLARKGLRRRWLAYVARDGQPPRRRRK